MMLQSRMSFSVVHMMPIEEMSSSQSLVEKAPFKWCNAPGPPYWDNPIKYKLVKATTKTQLHAKFEGKQNYKYQKTV